MDGDLHFPGVEAFRQSISRAMESAKGPETVLVVDVKQVKEIDYTALKVGICIIWNNWFLVLMELSLLRWSTR